MEFDTTQKVKNVKISQIRDLVKEYLLSPVNLKRDESDDNYRLNTYCKTEALWCADGDYKLDLEVRFGFALSNADTIIRVSQGINTEVRVNIAPEDIYCEIDFRDNHGSIVMWCGIDFNLFKKFIDRLEVPHFL